MSVSPKPRTKPPVHPGTLLLKEFLEPMQLTQVAFADAIGVSRAYVSDIVNGRRGISVEMAMRFEAALGPSAEFWIRAQTATDLYRAQHDQHILALQRKVKRLAAA